MRDDNPPSPPAESNPWTLIYSQGADPAQLVGLFAIEPAPLNSGAHFRTIRIESASRDRAGSLILNARTVEIDGYATVAWQSDRVRILGQTPEAFCTNALTAKVRCDMANEAMTAYLARSHRARDEFDADLHRILAGRLG